MGQLEKLLNGRIERPSIFEPGIAARNKREGKMLIEFLKSSEHREEAPELIRSMIEAIVLKPSVEGGMPIIDLVGDLVVILSVAFGRDKPEFTAGLSASNPDECKALVAGEGFEPKTFRL